MRVEKPFPLPHPAERVARLAAWIRPGFRAAGVAVLFLSGAARGEIVVLRSSPGSGGAGLALAAERLCALKDVPAR